MNDFLSFDTPLPCELRIKLTNTAVNDASKFGCGRMWFKACSGSEKVLVRYDPNRDRYFIHLGKKVFSCCINSEENASSNYYFLATGIAEEDFRRKNEALHSGLCFYCASGILISYFSSEQSKSFHMKSGSELTFSPMNANGTPAVFTIRNSFANLKPSAEQPITDDNSPGPELMEYLRIAKEYSATEHMLEEIRAQQNEPVHFDKIEGCDYARIANSAYRFFVNRLDEKNYILNARVEVVDINDEKLRATIIDFGTDEEKGAYMDLLFNEQVSLDKIQPLGSINLSLSTVNRDVQQKAIEKIIDGSSDAKYMDNVLGKEQPIGFYDIDLSELKQELASYKYPPNQSQVDAIEKGICTKDVYLVMGPPGTGKTTVILEWIKYFIKEKNMRVLVSSQNNKAVDNVLERIIQEDGIDALRIGSESKVTEQVKPCLFDLKLGNLREKIKDTTDNHKSHISKYSEYWNGIYTTLDALSDDYKDIEELENALDKACINLASLYDAIVATASRHAVLKAQISAKVAKINQLIEKEIQYQKGSKAMRILLFIVSFIRKLRISFGISGYDKKVTTLNSIEMQYDLQCKNYLTLYDNTALEVFAPKLEKGEHIIKKMNGISIDYDSHDKWNFFDFSKYKDFDITSSKFYYGLTGNIKTSITNSESLYNELEKWQGVAADTANYTLQSILLDGVNLVGATCIGINSQHRFSDLKFDVSIIDEAGQIQIHNALVPMSVSNKLIMLGDHKQIPPMADDDLMSVLKEHGMPTELLEKSLFEVLYNNLPDTNKSMLDTQYRMPAEIAEIISDWFYDGNYKSFSGNCNMESILPALSKCPFLIIDTSKNRNRFERSMENGEQIVHDNPLEASIAAQIVDILNQKDYDLNNVGIIAALKAQVDLIRKELKYKGIPSEVTNELAATLDSYQGQERNIIIYSFSRSANKAPDKNGVGFLTELRRLNVAMSRCKKTLIMIGDMSFLRSRESTVDYLGNEIDSPEKTEKNFAKFINHMLTYVEKGSGELIDTDEFDRRMEIWKNQE